MIPMTICTDYGLPLEQDVLGFKYIPLAPLLEIGVFTGEGWEWVWLGYS